MGGAIAAHLRGRGIDVVALGRRPVAGWPEGQQVTLDIGTAGAAPALQERVPPCDAIVHAAASLDKGLCTPSVSLTNCLGTQEMLQLASSWRVRHFIYLSGVAVIGTPTVLPITETHPANPPTAYHASKLYGEILVRLAEQEGIPGTTLRLTSPIGPGIADHRIFSVFVRQALAGAPLKLSGRGTRRQDYVDVRDVAAAVEACLGAGAAGLCNLGSGRDISNEELARACISTLNSKSEIVFSGQPDPEEGVVWQVSIERARRSFGYQPRFPLDESIRSIAAADAHRGHP